MTDNMTENADWDARVRAAADKISLETNESLQEWASPETLRALGEYLAANVLYDLDEMKRPGIMHRVFESQKKREE